MGNIYLITGATSDVGKALIERIYTPGDIVIAQGAGDVSGMADLCKKYEGIKTYDIDLTSTQALDIFIDDIKSRYGTPTHIVHLPALRVINTKFKKFDEDRYHLDMQVQVDSAIRICKTFLPLMAKEKRGRVLFMLTNYIMGVPPKNTTAYVVAKSALAGLAKSLAVEYAGFGITVNSVMPSMMETKFLADTPDLIVQAAAESHPMGRNATVDDVVPAMAFLLSEEASFITGVSLPITGGSTI